MKRISQFINGKPISLEIHPVIAVIPVIIALYKVGAVVGKALYYLTN